MTAECASAVLEAAEKKRQSLGLKTVGPGPSAVDRSEKEFVSTTRAREASADKNKTNRGGGRDYDRS